MKYEHTVAEHHGQLSELQDMIREYSNWGWELVSVHSISAYKVWLFFKKGYPDG